jgi:hypothetical protein
MKKIRLGNKDIFALVDDSDFEMLSSFKWSYHTGGYVRTKIQYNLVRTKILMHRLIMGLGYKDKREVDHIDFNGLNNQRSNLRICTRCENARNVRHRDGCISKYLGVCRDRKSQNESYKWRAQIKKEGIMYRSKRFPLTPEGEIEAALWYNEKAKELFGEFANPNVIEKLVYNAV